MLFYNCYDLTIYNTRSVFNVSGLFYLGPLLKIVAPFSSVYDVEDCYITLLRWITSRETFQGLIACWKARKALQLNNFSLSDKML